MWLFFLYVVLLGWVLWKYLNVVINARIVLFVWFVKSFFIFLISYSSFQNYSFLNVPDEDNYFHDALLFNDLAKEKPLFYLKFLLDKEPADEDIFNRYYTQTQAWYKAPEFFYNDNRWVVKIYSILVFFSEKNLSVLRLFSAFFALIGFFLIWLFFKYLWGKIDASVVLKKSNESLVFLISQCFPFYFFYTSFVLKESLLILILGVALVLLYQMFFYERKRGKYILMLVLLLPVLMTFRPLFTLSALFFSTIFMMVIKYVKSYKTPVFIGCSVICILLIIGIFKKVLSVRVFNIIQYRQERFLDASKGGIFLLNSKKFVRVPYDWKGLKIDSSQSIPSVCIRKSIPIMYWELTHLNDTIFVENKDTTEEYKVLYFIEKAHRTVYIQPLNSRQSIPYNFISILQALNVFFFYPQCIESIMDLVVWFESLGILLGIVMLLFWGRYKYNYFSTYLLFWMLLLIVIIALTSPNTGAIVRYRYFILPVLFINFAYWYLSKQRIYSK